MVDDQDKEIYYPMSFLEQMTWVQEDIEHILNNNTLETMRSAGIERFGEPGYGGSIKRLLEIIKSDPKNKPLLREIIKAEKELLLFIYDEHTDLTEEYIRNYWKEFFEAYCHVLEQTMGEKVMLMKLNMVKAHSFSLLRQMNGIMMTTDGSVYMNQKRMPEKLMTGPSYGGLKNRDRCLFIHLKGLLCLSMSPLMTDSEK